MRKKEFTSFDVAAVVRELKATILDSRVSNVYQLDAKTLILKLHKPDNPPLALVLEAGRRLHLTSYSLEKPIVPPAFCMALRKYLRNSRLISIVQYEFERVVVFRFTTKEGNVQLVLELFGDGNIILIDENDRIMQALIYKRMRDRDIVRNEQFKFAPSSGKNPLKVSVEEFRKGLLGFGDVEVVRGLARFLSIGGVYAEEVLFRADVGKTKPCNALSENEVDAVFGCLQVLLSQVTDGALEPRIVLDEAGGFVDVEPFKLRRYEGAGTELQTFSSFNEALDEFYVRVTALEKALAGVEVDQLRREAERLKRIIADQEKALAEAEAEANRDKRIGDTIYAHSSEVQGLLARFSVGDKGSREWSTIVSEVLKEKAVGKGSSIFESFDNKSLVINVCVDDLHFGLSLRKSLFENAAEFYEHAKRAKQKLTGATEALEDTRKKLRDVEAEMSKAEVLEHAKPMEAVEQLALRRAQRKEWFEKFRWFVSSDGFLVVAGKDAVSNEVLIKKHADEKDVVFHADIVGAPFVVIKTSGKEISEQCLREAGEFAAAFSRGWREGFGSVDVYWVKPEQLSKSGPSGEFVAHGAFVVSGKRNWMRNVPLRLGIGVIVYEEGGNVSFVGGPVDSVKTRTKAHVVIAPGNVAAKELFRHILRILGGKMSKELRDRIVKASVEEIREFVPYGVGRVLET
ncbi:MAG TPA: ribosome rescue protein RqcH [Candidatus Acidoferrum sp.]|nr:ribosome rescue protein RqcH [Candidatus Acidoferrum sp.]